MENLWKTVTENVGFIVVIAITAAVLFAVAKLGEMWAGVTSSQQMRTKKNVTIGMMSALAFILHHFTVGFGVVKNCSSLSLHSPNQPQKCGSRTLPPVGIYTPPQRIFHFPTDSLTQQSDNCKRFLFCFHSKGNSFFL